MIVLAEMAIGALHSLFKVNVGEMNSFAEAIGIVERNFRAVLVKPVPFSIVRVNPAIDPSVPVEIGEPSSLELLVEFGAAGLFQKFFVTP